MTEAQRWSEVRELGFITGMRMMFWIYRHIGAWAFSLVLQPVVLYYFLTNSNARRSSLDYLQRLHRHSSPNTSPRPNWISCYRHLLAFSRATVDKLGVWADSDMLASVQFPNRHRLMEQLDTGRGAILLGAHLGNMEVCRSLSRNNRRLKLNILVHTGNADMFNHLLQEMEIHCELELIEVSSLSPATAIHLAACVERGEFIVIMADRVPVASGGRSRPVEFLGHPALFPEGPFILASLLKCPVYTVFCTRSKPGYQVNCEHFAQSIKLPRKSRDTALQNYMQQFARTLESNVRAAPLQWFNFYPYWDQAP